MNRKQLGELLKYSSPFSILIVTYKNKIIELHCPFEVHVREDIGLLKKGNIEQVEMVKLSFKMITVFVIKEENYFYFWFNILID